MSVSGVSNSQHHHVDGDVQQQIHQPGGHGWRGRWHGHESGGDSERTSDSHFTPSGGNGSNDHESAGTYQVTQVQMFSATAFALLAQFGPSAPAAPSTDSSSQSTPVSDSSTVAAAQTPAATWQTAPQTVDPAPSDTGTSAPDGSTTGVTAAVTPGVATGVTTSNSQDPLSALNGELQTLGLSSQQIQAFDQIANFINSVSPAAFADLVNQFQALAQQSSQGQQSSVAPATSSTVPSAPSDNSTAVTSADANPATGTASGTPATGGTSPATATAPGGTYQIEEISIRFSDIDIKGNTGATDGSGGSTGGTFDVSAFKLNIQEVTMTLNDGNGQTAQIATSQPPATGNSSSGQSSVSSVAAV
jgi:hypothetical protein